MAEHPPTYAGRRQWVTAMAARAVRRGCGIRQGDIAAALGVSTCTVSVWERGLVTPTGRAGDAYCRVIAGMARHLEVDGG